jgi:hypothetical protein
MRSILAYAWASPNSLIGLAAGGAMILLGGRARRIAGVLEVAGGLVGTQLGRKRITLGHVILGIDDAALEQSRAHELVHVRQYEQWGPFFLPAYAASSLWQLACGRRCYRDNWFERQANERS